ncbi:MAG TPA: hypothetical protein VJU16_03915 [Planctomycetota bacterium]|nr:hypothetical protein [Planctomycetota bacterium]
MRHSWSAVVLLSCACAAPETIQREIQLRPLPSPRGAFHVSDFSGEPETHRYRLKPGDLFAWDAVAELDIRPSEGAPRAKDPASESLVSAADAIRAMIPNASWDSDARFALYVEKDELVVRHTRAVLTQVERLIETLKANRNTMVRLQVQFLTIPLEEMGAIRHLPPIREGLGGVIDRREIVTLAKSCIPQ